MELLLVEAYAPLARVLRMGLTEEGFVVTTANGLDKARDLLNARKFDVVLLDPPAPMGQGALQEWRRARITTPVLLLTPPGRHLANGQEAEGPVAFLAKPFRFDDLLDRLRHLGRWT